MPNDQPTLFDMTPSPVGNGFYDDITAKPARASRGAGKRNRNDVYQETMPRHGKDGERVLQKLRSLGYHGATRDELSISLLMPLTTVCGRVNELLKQQLILETDQRRQTRTGSTAVVLRSAYAK